MFCIGVDVVCRWLDKHSFDDIVDMRYHLLVLYGLFCACNFQVMLYGVVWTFYFILPIISGAERTHVNDTFTLRPNTCLMALEGQTLPIAAPCVEAKQFNERVVKLKSLVLSSSVPLSLWRFWSGNSLNKNKAMVEHLQHYGVISSKKVAEVMEAVDRALFVPDGSPPYLDSPMSIGYNATISAPHMHATCLQLLEENLQPGMRALDIGSGTGYLTACFALMVGPQGHAVGVEHIPELVSSSIQNIEKSAAASLLKEGSLQVHVGDGRLGWPELAPYDAIHVGAAAPEIPQPLIDQLKPGGRMVIPVGNIFQDLKVVDKNLDGSVSVRSETSVRYVPLTTRDAQLRNY
ncbi:hypothetical protein FEM48_Zijuj05G0060500 [Ziziphus jujuba var. spinosa]|uniref:protein-L-isoaspartate(D-aspartate) O-methyltransferase n=1 Tax=Ziziphus jujuba var. spinosa TaxID=714518 RepID=A0A978VD84_ZIZJJ|nr:hypothetical protein FEM48_Zijuj05G0060500 [Ziziphus jujuba var. spinosa]